MDFIFHVYQKSRRVAPFNWRLLDTRMFRTHQLTHTLSCLSHSLTDTWICIEVECFKSTKFQRWSSTTCTHTCTHARSSMHTHILYSEIWLYEIAKWRHPHTIAYKCIIIFTHTCEPFHSFIRSSTNTHTRRHARTHKRARATNTCIVQQIGFFFFSSLICM